MSNDRMPQEENKITKIEKTFNKSIADINNEIKQWPQDYTWDVLDLYDTLITMRNTNNASKELVHMLEYEYIYEKATELECKAYVNFLLENYIKYDELEAIRTIYGFLEGFKDQNENLEKRYENFYKLVQNNQFQKNHYAENTVHKNVREYIDSIILQLVKKIIGDVIDREGKLNIWENAPKEMIWEKPKKLREEPFVIEKKSDNTTTKSSDKSTLKQLRANETMNNPRNENDSDISDETKAINRSDDITDCIESIRMSEHHDDVAVKLYEALCGESDPPYNKWVATWIVKCICKSTSWPSFERDILFASFALLPDYQLNKDDPEALKRRLHRYLNESDYLTLYPSKSGLPFVEILDQDERGQILKELEKDEQLCVDDLVEYVKKISNPKKHIRKLKKYGKFDEQSNSFFLAKPPKMFLYRGRIEEMKKMGNTLRFVLLSLLLICVIPTAIFFKNLTPNSGDLIEQSVYPKELNGRSNRNPYGKTDGITPNMALQDNLAFDGALLAHTLKHVEE